MHKKILIILLILVFAISGCATRTRIGALIPAHHLSNQRSGEEVWLHVARTESPTPETLLKIINNEDYKALLAYCNPKFSIQMGPLPALAAMAAGAAIDYLKSELQEEAKSYDASFGAKAWLNVN